MIEYRTFAFLGFFEYSGGEEWFYFSKKCRWLGVGYLLCVQQDLKGATSWGIFRALQVLKRNHTNGVYVYLRCNFIP